MPQFNYNSTYDITPVVSEKMGVFPGDQAFTRKVVMDTDNGDHIGLSSITSTLHIGAHADAPNHYSKNATGIDTRDLDYYMGPCQVVDVSQCKESYIQVSDLTSKITKGIVLFKTLSFPDPDHWNSDFKGLSPELIEHLAKLKVKTIAIDTPSIDIESSKDLPAHHMVATYDMAILEGVVLSDVSADDYFLMALPLKLKDCDASPVRAVLLK